MIVSRISLQYFRNYEDISLELNPRGNLLFGKNGQGKTNFLEALFYLSVFRSFRKASGRDIVQWDRDWFRITGFLETDTAAVRSLDVVWDRTGSNQVQFENDRVSRLADAVGLLPVVVLSPESLDISQGPPSERRKFLDMCFSMTDPEYLNRLTQYRRVLRQRNTLLSTSDTRSPSFDSAIEPWNEKLIEHGSFITNYRSRAVGDFAGICAGACSEISGESEDLRISYSSQVSGDGDIRERFRAELAESRDEEYRRRTTLVGPHRDELLFFLNGRDARKFASQGQHKTILLSLKAAEIRYITEKKGTAPVILLDDFFALLDERRIMLFIGILKRHHQFLITSNMQLDPGELLSRAGFETEEFSQYSVEGGRVQSR